MAPSSPDVVPVNVRCGTGEILSMDVNTTWTVSQLKSGLEAAFGVPYAVQNLGSTMRGTSWDDNASVKECGVRRGGTVNLWWAPLRVHHGRKNNNSNSSSFGSAAAAGGSPSSSPSSSSSSSQHLFVFDLDDTLTRNGVMSAATKRCLETLAADHSMAIASFNLSAVEFIQRCGCLHLFDVIVCGFYEGVSKNDHMAKCLEQLHWPALGNSGRGSVYFFDDQAVNVEDVRTAFPGTVCLHVRSLESLPLLVESLMSISRMRTATTTTTGATSSSSSSSHHLKQHSSPSSTISSASTVGRDRDRDNRNNNATNTSTSKMTMGFAMATSLNNNKGGGGAAAAAGVPYPRLHQQHGGGGGGASALPPSASRRLSVDSDGTPRSSSLDYGSRRNSRSNDPAADGVAASFASISLGASSALRV